jgi:hypothetical protein
MLHIALSMFCCRRKKLKNQIPEVIIKSEVVNYEGMHFETSNDGMRYECSSERDEILKDK